MTDNNNLDDRLDVLERNVQAILDGQATAAEILAGMHQRLDGIDSRLGKIETDINVIKTLLGIANLDPEAVRTAALAGTGTS